MMDPLDEQTAEPPQNISIDNPQAPFQKPQSLSGRGELLTYNPASTTAIKGSAGVDDVVSVPPSAVVAPNVDSFAIEKNVLFSAIQTRIDMENESNKLKWVFDVGWTNHFATEVGPADAPLRLVATIIRLSLEKKAVSLPEYLLDALADAVRRYDQWRVLFGECGIVEECLSTIERVEVMMLAAGEIVQRKALRLLVNCCGDPQGDGSADGNRSQVVARLSFHDVLFFMESPDWQTEAVSLVYNIGAYDEIYQISAIDAGLRPALWNVLRNLDNSSSADLRILAPACEMLTWCPDKADTSSNTDTFHVLSRLSRRELTSEDVMSMIDITSFILSKHGLPKNSLSFVGLLDFISSTCILKTKTPSNPLASTKRFSGDEEESLEPTREALIVQLSTLCAGPTEALQWPATSPPFQTLISWLTTSHYQLQICALTMLGNLAYQSEILTLRLLQEALGQGLFVLFNTEKNGLVLKTALGAVEILARSDQTRDSLGQSNIIAAIAPGWTQGINAPLQTAALSATRRLLSGSLQNLNRFLMEQNQQEKFLLDVLLEAFFTSETPESRMDIAWTLERIWRFIYSDADVRELTEGKGKKHSIDTIARGIVRNTIPNVYKRQPRVLEPFLAILSSGDRDRIVAATYTLSMMLTAKGAHNAVYATLCLGDGRAIILSTLKDIGNPKAQMNAQTLVHQLKSHFSTDQARSLVLENLIDESRGATTAETVNSIDAERAS